MSTDDMTEGKLLHGFIVRGVTELPGIRCSAVEAEHMESGARLLHLRTNDRENYFSAGFRTPPPDSTGLPHILEHTVLSGSKKYPLKDPFIQLLKTSMVTFLNAFTYPDRTVYPCSSRNAVDFRNLMEVYCDAVLNPRLDRFSFMQEGHHLDFETPGDTGSGLTVRGIVYNEMKGAYSDPEQIIEEGLIRAIFPDSVYGLDSGGDPDHIPDLTYEVFIDFYRRYYHPSNCWFFLYGDIPTADHLEFLHNGYLSRFARTVVDTRIEYQPRWSEPRRLEAPLPAEQGAGSAGRSSQVTGWLTGSVTDAQLILSMHLLDDYLLGNDAAPLRKALIDSGLGMGLVCSGFSSHRMESVFSAGLRGIETGDSGEVSRLIRDILTDQADRGLDGRSVEASLHRLELSSMEIGSAWPYRLMSRVYRSWMTGGDPLYWLRLDEHLNGLREMLEKKPGCLEGVLSDQLCSNPHRVDMTFYPDTEFTTRREAEFAERMRILKEGMTEEQLTGIAWDTAALEKTQTIPDPPETLALLPRLRLGDVEREPRRLHTETRNPAGIPLLVTDVFNNGLCYLEMSFGIQGLDEDLFPLVPVFCDAVIGMGAEGSDYSEMALREAACCAGISALPTASCSSGSAMVSMPSIQFSTRCLDEKLPQMLDVMTERILRADFSDAKRLSDLIREEAVTVESTVVSRGNRFAVLRAARGLNRSSSLCEHFEGISSLREFSALAGEEETDSTVVGKMERIRSFILGRMDLTCSVVCSPGSLNRIEDWLAAVAASGGDGTTGGTAAEPTRTTGRIEGIALSTSVSYVGLSVPGLPFSHRRAPALRFLSKQLSFGYLWDEIRTKRGAYGAAAAFSPATGTFSLSSYRDPSIIGTIETFNGVLDYIEQRMDLSPATVESGIISTLKDLDPPERPEAASRTALYRHLAGIGLDELRDYRSRLLELTADELRQVSKEVLRPAWEDASVCVISSRELLEDSSGSLGGMVTTGLTKG